MVRGLLFMRVTSQPGNVKKEIGVMLRVSRRGFPFRASTGSTGQSHARKSSSVSLVFRPREMTLAVTGLDRAGTRRLPPIDKKNLFTRQVLESLSPSRNILPNRVGIVLDSVIPSRHNVGRRPAVPRCGKLRRVRARESSADPCL